MAELGEQGDMGAPEVEILGAEANGGQGNADHGGRLTWTSVMSSFILHCFSDLVDGGLKTDKGFKEQHLNAVARDLSEFANVEVTGNQVYNHLRKWRARWVKICRLRELSGALWDEVNFMITLDDEHYAGHVKDHPKDAEFLNSVLVNYLPMQNIFGTGVATGRFAMGSGEALGDPATQETIDLETDAPPPSHPNVPIGSNEKGSSSGQADGKRKRGFTEEEGDFLGGLTKAVQGMADAVREGTPGIYRAVMDRQGSFSRDALMHSLNFLMKNKGTAEGFMEMDEVDKDFWLRDHLAATNFYG